MPGTGKTATVREVIRELREEMDFNVRLYVCCNANSTLKLME